ncbi:MAG: putative Peptidylprolyl isomerase [Nitrosopumilales archaeon]|nr:MAG: putative Peptidylprolyl isomerase [Nitrosopumilales archaeon]
MYKKLFFFVAIVFLLLNIPNPSNAQSSEKLVVFHTQLGKIVIELFPNDAPKTVDNFVKLANEGFYDDTIFHRIIQDFMIQGGDPLSKQSDLQRQWGTGNAGYNIQAEFNTIEHDRGIVSMARSADPNSASSQFFIVHKDSNFLDEQYTIFGRIVTQESFETLDRIAALETGANDVPINAEEAKVLKVEVKQRSEILDLLELGQPERIPMPAPNIVEETTEGGGCLIATATFGSELSPQVQMLREIRDNSLLETESGSTFMKSFNKFYYSFSPGIADLERESPLFKEAVKLVITPLLTSLSILNYVELDSEETVLGYGISLILLNVGMYFVAPATILIRIFKRQ